jgi:MoxR-like ATPase
MVSTNLRPASDGLSNPAELVQPVLEALGRIIVGKPTELRLSLACLLARGHLMIEDLPGVGKTTLAHALAKTLDLDYQRIQFTSDLLPADVIGVSVYGRDSGRFEFHKGPIFSNLVLADEINRATPKAQSALLEAMEERQVTADGETYSLPAPFFVVATRNPTEQIGTFPLPESQLDRFLMQITLGYPLPAEERQLLANGDRRDLVDQLESTLSVDTLLNLQNSVTNVHVSDALLDYVQAIVAHTRESGMFRAGLSPRGAIALVRASQSWAMMSDHSGVYPEDVQAVLPSVVGHRLEPAQDTELQSAGIGESILEAVPVA